MQSSTKKIIKFAFLLVLFSIFLSTVVSVYSLNRMAEENQKEINLLLAARIHDTINGELSRPVMVAETMANNRFLLDFLQREEGAQSEAASVKAMQDYLRDLVEELGYDTAFVVSEESRRYYTNVGLNKVIDPQNDAHDIWYPTFIRKNRDYDLGVDVDEVHDNVWTVFVNSRIEADGKLLGVCGVGVKMHSLQNLLTDYEKQYGIKINMIDASGLVLVDTNEINIENAYLNDVDISEEDSSEYVYREGKRGEYIVSKYVENLSWFLVVQRREHMVDRALRGVLLLNMLLFAFVAAAFLTASLLVQRHTRMLVKSSYLDELTKLPNRRAYEEKIAQLAAGSLKSGFVYANIDVNGLKAANDTLGHAAGDELICGVAECLQDAFARYGQVFRTGGDEFAAILDMPQDIYEKVKSALQDSLSKWHGNHISEISVSVGYVPRWEAPDLSLEEIIAEADKRMYAVKQAYYQSSETQKR